MTTLLLIVWVILAVKLLLLFSMRVKRSVLSRFELERRHDEATIRRERLIGDVVALKRFASLVIVILMSAVAMALWQWTGIFYVITIVLFLLSISQWRPLTRLGNKQYAKFEPRILRFVERSPIIGKILGSEKVKRHDFKLESTDELLHIVKSSGQVLTAEQRSVIVKGIDWHEKKIESVMTPREEVDSVPASELLGPLVLHDLHQTGHTVFPVIKKDFDHVVGVLDIAELLRIDKSTHTHKAEQVMQQDVYTVVQDATLPIALQLFMSTHTPLLVVTDNADKAVGIITLRDVIGALLGKNI